jgi:hypothetical protein
MVIAALIAFASLLIAWLVAPSGRRRGRAAALTAIELVPEPAAG